MGIENPQQRQLWLLALVVQHAYNQRAVNSPLHERPEGCQVLEVNDLEIWYTKLAERTDAPLLVDVMTSIIDAYAIYINGDKDGGWQMIISKPPSRMAGVVEPLLIIENKRKG